jgi:hypothetical protein
MQAVIAIAISSNSADVDLQVSVVERFVCAKRYEHKSIMFGAFFRACGGAEKDSFSLDMADGSTEAEVSLVSECPNIVSYKDKAAHLIVMLNPCDFILVGMSVEGMDEGIHEAALDVCQAVRYRCA